MTQNENHDASAGPTTFQCYAVRDMGAAERLRATLGWVSCCEMCSSVRDVTRWSLDRRINEGHLHTRQSSALESSDQRAQLIRDQPPLAGIQSSQELQFSGKPIDL